MNTKTKSMLLKKVIISLLILSITLPILMPLKSVATSISVSMDTKATNIRKGDTVYVNVYVTGDAISGISGYLEYDKDLFDNIKNSSLIISEKLKGDDGYGTYSATFTSDINKLVVLESEGGYYTIPDGGLLLQIKLVAKKDVTSSKIKFKTIEVDGENDYYSADDTECELPAPGAQEYIVRYNASTTETVTNMPDNDKKTQGLPYTVSTTIPERTGYTFKGWNTQSDGSGTPYAAGSVYSQDANLELYAQWEIIKTTLTVNPNGGVWDGSSANQTFTQGYDTTKTINIPTTAPNGNIVKFNGNGGTPDTLQITQTMRFKEWKLTGGGTFVGTTYTFKDTTATLIAEYEGNSIVLPNATKTGSTFKGWYTSSTGGTKVGEAGDNYTPTSATTLFAQWNEVEYTLTVNPNGGTWNGTTNNSTVKGAYNDTTAITNPTAPNGYTITLNNDGVTSREIQTMRFDKWVATGNGSIDRITYTFGNGDGQLTATYIANSVELETLSKTGYTFDGWYTLQNGGTKITSPYTPTNDITLYAHWTANQYNITFNPSTGTITGSNTKQVTYGQNYGTLPTPTRPGYTFDGWYNGSNKIESTTTVNITSDTTLTAKWLGAEYTVNFDADGGTVSTTSKTVRNEGTYGELPTPTKTGYTFKGWYNGSNKVESTTTVNITTDITLKAQWEAIKTQLTVNPNNGTWNGSTTAQNFTQDFNTTKQINNPTANPDGFVVNFDTNGGTSDKTQITQTTVFDKWNLAGGGTFVGTTYTFAETAGTLTASYKGQNIILPNATKTGTTFKGWYTSKTGGSKIGEAGDSYLPTSAITLYAQWNEVEYTLIVNPNGGTWKGVTSNSTVKGAYNTTTEISNPVAPNGYKVAFDSNDGTGTKQQVIQTKTFKQWTTQGIGTIKGTQYTFGTNDETITAEYTDNSINLPTATRQGYTLDGWYTQSVGGTKIESPYMPTNDETLYAHWTANQYNVTFNPAKGTLPNGEGTKQVTYGQAYGTLPTPTRTGYDFVGWYDDAGNQIESATIANITSDTTLTAKWLGAELTINFDADGGTVIPTSKTVRNEGTYGELPIPNKQGHTFIGWYDDNENKIESTTIVNITENQTLHAKYEKNKYTVTFKNDDGSILYTTTIQYQDKVEYSGKTPETTKATPGYDAKFKGWDNENVLNSVTQDTTVTATYELSIIQYKIIYNNLKNSDNSKNPSTYTIKDKNITLTDLPNQQKFIFKGWFNKALGGNQITSIDTSKLENIIVYAQWEEDNLYLKSEKYKIGENDIDNYEQGDIYLDKIEPNTTLKQFIENCDTNGIIKVIDKDGKELKEDDLIGTGMTIKDTRYDEEITLTAVVMGDLDGNGIVTITDFSAINQVLLEIATLEEPYFKAADLDDNKKLTITDFSTINNTILGNITLTYTKPKK